MFPYESPPPKDVVPDVFFSIPSVALTQEMKIGIEVNVITTLFKFI